MSPESFFLLISKNPGELKRLDTIIRDMGYSNIQAVVGSDRGWIALQSKTPDCIIADYDMEDMSGLALMKIARSKKEQASVPFFLIDPAFTKIKVLKAGQAGVTGLFVIPLDPSAIKSKIVKALSRKPDPVIAKSQNKLKKGQQLLEQGRYEEALEIFTSLVTQKDKPEYYFNIGFIKTNQGKYGEAIDAFSKATQLDRLFARAYEEMAKAYRALGNTQKAEEYMQEAAEIYMEGDKIDSAEGIINQLIESGSSSLNVFNTLGVIYRKKGQMRMAIKQYKKALQIHPDEPYILYNLGRLYLDTKSTQKARQHFLKAVELEPDFKEARQVIKAIDLGLV